MIDSVFSIYAETKYDGDRPEIPVTKIVEAMDGIENRAIRRYRKVIEEATDQLLKEVEPALRNQNLRAIADLTWNLAVTLQRPLAQEWREGWLLGQEQGIEAMQASAPASQATFSIADDIRALLGLSPTGIVNPSAEAAIQQRVLRLAGDFSEALLARLKTDLIAAVQPQPDTGDPISRRDLLDRIQKTLNVGEVRASTIARTELTNAYNQGRLSSYEESDLVEYVRFMAIRDDRTTNICRSRQGLVFEKGSPEMAANTPPLHFQCRSVLSPLMPKINPRHRKMVEDPGRDPSNRKLTPLPKGWRS